MINLIDDEFHFYFLIDFLVKSDVTPYRDGLAGWRWPGARGGNKVEEHLKVGHWAGVSCEAPNPEWSFHLSDDIILRYFLYKGLRNNKEKEISPFEMFETVDPN